VPLFLPLCPSRVLVASYLSLSVACSLTLSIPLPLTIHRQAHRHVVQCIRPLTTACFSSYSFGDCVTAASYISVASLLLHLCRSLALLLFRFRLLLLSAASPMSFSLCLSLALSIARSYSSSPSSLSTSMYSPSDFRLLFLVLFRPLRHCRFVFVCRSLLKFIGKLIVVFNAFAHSNPTTRTPTTYS
jgi:hypothetical protein